MARKYTKALRRTAIHEAGHALACCILRRKFRKVSIIPEGKSDGRLYRQGISRDWRLLIACGYEEHYANVRKVVEAEVRILLAGDIAERIIVGKSRHSSHTSSRDFHKALRILKLYFFKSQELITPCYGWLWLETKSMLGIYENQKAIEALAEVLLEKRTVGYVEARKALTTAVYDYRDKCEAERNIERGLELQNAESEKFSKELRVLIDDFYEEDAPVEEAGRFCSTRQSKATGRSRK